MSYPGIQISRLGSAVFVPKNFSALLTRDIRNIGNCIFFAEQKKSNGAAGEKKFRVRCKNLAFCSTESHIESFFAEQKRENGAAGKKKIEVQPGWCGQQPSSPWYSRGSTMGFFFFFFFFFPDFCCAATELYTVAEPLIFGQNHPPPREPCSFFSSHFPFLVYSRIVFQGSGGTLIFAPGCPNSRQFAFCT